MKPNSQRDVPAVAACALVGISGLAAFSQFYDFGCSWALLLFGCVFTAAAIGLVLGHLWQTVVIGVVVSLVLFSKFFTTWN